MKKIAILFFFMFVLNVFSQTTDIDQKNISLHKFSSTYAYDIFNNMIKLQTNLKISTDFKDIDGDSEDISNNDEICISNLTINSNNQLYFAVNNQYSPDSVGFIVNTFEDPNYGRYTNPTGNNDDSNILGILNKNINGISRTTSDDMTGLNSIMDCVLKDSSSSCSYGYRNHIGNVHPTNNHIYAFKSALFCSGKIKFFRFIRILI